MLNSLKCPVSAQVFVHWHIFGEQCIMGYMGAWGWISGEKQWIRIRYGYISGHKALKELHFGPMKFGAGVIGHDMLQV